MILLAVKNRFLLLMSSPLISKSVKKLYEFEIASISLMEIAIFMIEKNQVIHITLYISLALKR